MSGLPSIRLPVLIAGLPPMTGELIGALLERDPLAEVHRHGDGGAGLVDAVERLRARILIVGPECLDAAQAAAASSRPDLKVLVVAADGGDSALHEFVPVRRRLGEISASTLMRAVREACVPPARWETV